jgi:hypothetical protein
MKHDAAQLRNVPGGDSRFRRLDAQAQRDLYRVRLRREKLQAGRCEPFLVEQ